MANASNTVVLNAVWESREANTGIGKTNTELNKVEATAKRIGTQSSKSLDEFARRSKNLGSGFTASRNEIDRVHDTIKKLSGVLGPLGEFFTKSLTIPLGLLGFAAFEARRKLDTLERGLEQILGSSALARAKLQELSTVAKLPGLDLVNTIQGVARLSAAGLGVGLATDAIKEFGNALALVGGTTEDLAGVSLALQQIASKTRVSAEEINQIAERVPTLQTWTQRLIIPAL